MRTPVPATPPRRRAARRAGRSRARDGSARPAWPRARETGWRRTEARKSAHPPGSALPHARPSNPRLEERAVYKGGRAMWQDVGEVAVDVLLPSGPGPDLDALLDKNNPDVLRVPLDESGGFASRLNRSGWFDEEVVAGGILTQGKAQSLFSMFTGWALVELARGRRSKALPREFCVAVTATKVVALAMSPWSEGGGGDVATDVVVKVKREERGSWSR